jgi:hypothetical protein
MDLDRIVIDPEFAGLIPPLRDEERRDLEAGLLTDGCLSPLLVWRGKNVLLDGHNRHELCRRHGIACEVREIELPSREAAQAWVIRNQLGRRNLSESQRALLAAALADLCAVEAKARQQATRARPGQKVGAKVVANLPPPCAAAKARDEAASAMNVSPRLVQAARTVREKGAEALQRAVREGEVSVSAAAEVARLPRARQERLVSRGAREVARAAKLARQRRSRGGISKDAFRPVRGHSRPEPKTALSMPHDPKMGARTLLSVFDSDYLVALVRELLAGLPAEARAGLCDSLSSLAEGAPS